MSLRPLLAFTAALADAAGRADYAMDFDEATRTFTGARAISPPSAPHLLLENLKDATEVPVRITPNS